MPPAASLGPLADRLGQLERKLQQVAKPHDLAATAPKAPAATQAQIDRRVIEAIVSAVEKRLQEHSSQLQKRIGEVETAAAQIEMVTARRIEQETSALKGQVVAMQREFAKSVAGIVAEHVATQMAERTKAMEASIQASIQASVEPLREELRDLRQRITETENTMGEFVAAISDTVRRASERDFEVEEQAAPAVSSTSTKPQEAPRAAEPVPIRAHPQAPPQHLDLRVLRKRLRAVDLPERETRPSYLPLPASQQRKGPAPVTQFRVA